MRLTDQQIYAVFKEEAMKTGNAAPTITAVRRCLAMAAMPDVPHQAPYNDVERRGFEVSQPGELPR